MFICIIPIWAEKGERERINTGLALEGWYYKVKAGMCTYLPQEFVFLIDKHYWPQVNIKPQET
jgi:hypothetical protein